ncbi:MAG: DUF3365 domain-containing protein, partial [Pseudomonadota bacterium]|nr:DUF3365 domain-containing protein [Pseudomonadota bacterium]
MNSLSGVMIMVLAALPALAAEDTPLQQSRTVATSLMQQLGAELKQAISANGAEAAIKVCKNIAPDLASKLSIERGWRVTRVSLKTRNPLLGTPDAWEQQRLEEFDAHAANGAALDTMEFSESVTEPGGRYFRYMKALPVQPLCLACHGGEEQIPASVKATLSRQYPHDRATGY